MVKKTKGIYGLVLSGGKSTRMGMDKGTIAYHGIAQREYLYNMLEQVCEKTFISIRKKQEGELPKKYTTIVDKNQYKGPYNGILSAHDAYEDVAWLVLACDLPLMDITALKELIANRDTTKIATAYATQESQLPEPLAAIWEPDALRRSKAYLDAGNGTCPRKFLINSDTALQFPTNEMVLLNANSKAEYDTVRSKLASH